MNHIFSHSNMKFFLLLIPINYKKLLKPSPNILQSIYDERNLS